MKTSIYNRAVVIQNTLRQLEQATLSNKITYSNHGTYIQIQMDVPELELLLKSIAEHLEKRRNVFMEEFSNL